MFWKVGPINRHAIMLLMLLFFLGSLRGAENVTSKNSADLLIVVGAGGEASYGEIFSEWATMLQAIGEEAQAKVELLGPDVPDSIEGSLKDVFKEKLEAYAMETEEPLWIALIGHGTFNGRVAKFNVKGPDISTEELASWLKPLKRPVAVMNTSSASAPFLNALSGPNRVVLTATRDGFELNFARFGSYLVNALGSKRADLDKDGQTSLLEAFIMASRQVGEFYEIEGRLASEHALLDDTGDQKGIPADWFKGVRPVKIPEGNNRPDGRVAAQFHLIENELESLMSPEIKKRRDELEQAIFELRDHRGDMNEKAYFERLEALLIPFAELYQSVDSKSTETAE